MSPDYAKEALLPSSLIETLARSDELPNTNVLNRVTVNCLRGYCQNQLLRDIDATSMAHSIEVRVPYLDVPLLDMAMSLPQNAKWANLADNLNPYDSTYKTTGSKKILFDIGRDILPSDIDLQRKRGFSMPFGFWLKNEINDLFEECTSRKVVVDRGIFDTDSVAALKLKFYDGKIGWAQPWLVMLTELWCQEVLDG
jgi:asparagine synthase (glutamine-hydrolysing)